VARTALRLLSARETPPVSASVKDPPEDEGAPPKRDTGNRRVGRLRDEFAVDLES
jgi:hypothetical protein